MKFLISCALLASINTNYEFCHAWAILEMKKKFTFLEVWISVS